MIISQKLSSAITDTLSANNLISKQEAPIYLYCLDYIIELFFLFIFSILFGVLVHKLPETIIFLVVFTPIRSFGGGFHASTQRRCSVLSLAAFIFIIYSENITVLLTWQWTLAFAISILVIAILSPVGTKNRPMTQKRRKVLKKRCIFFCMLLTLLYLFFYINDFQIFYGTLSLCIIINFFSILAGYILEKKNAGKQNEGM